MLKIKFLIATIFVSAFLAPITAQATKSTQMYSSESSSNSSIVRNNRNNILMRTDRININNNSLEDILKKEYESIEEKVGRDIYTDKKVKSYCEEIKKYSSISEKCKRESEEDKVKFEKEKSILSLLEFSNLRSKICRLNIRKEKCEIKAEQCKKIIELYKNLEIVKRKIDYCNNNSQYRANISGLRIEQKNIENKIKLCELIRIFDAYLYYFTDMVRYKPYPYEERKLITIKTKDEEKKGEENIIGYYKENLYRKIKYDDLEEKEKDIDIEFSGVPSLIKHYNEGYDFKIDTIINVIKNVKNEIKEYEKLKLSAGNQFILENSNKLDHIGRCIEELKKKIQFIKVIYNYDEKEKCYIDETKLTKKCVDFGINKCYERIKKIGGEITEYIESGNKNKLNYKLKREDLIAGWIKEFEVVTDAVEKIKFKLDQDNEINLKLKQHNMLKNNDFDNKDFENKIKQFEEYANVIKKQLEGLYKTYLSDILKNLENINNGDGQDGLSFKNIDGDTLFRYEEGGLEKVKNAENYLKELIQKEANYYKYLEKYPLGSCEDFAEFTEDKSLEELLSCISKQKESIDDKVLLNLGRGDFYRQQDFTKHPDYERIKKENPKYGIIWKLYKIRQGLYEKCYEEMQKLLDDDGKIRLDQNYKKAEGVVSKTLKKLDELKIKIENWEKYYLKELDKLEQNQGWKNNDLDIVEEKNILDEIIDIFRKKINYYKKYISNKVCVMSLERGNLLCGETKINFPGYVDFSNKRKDNKIDVDENKVFRIINTWNNIEDEHYLKYAITNYIRRMNEKIPKEIHILFLKDFDNSKKEILDNYYVYNKTLNMYDIDDITKIDTHIIDIKSPILEKFEDAEKIENFHNMFELVDRNNMFGRIDSKGKNLKDV